MSDCSTHAFEYPGMSRLIIRWTDPNERPHDWPFVMLGREVASVEVDGIEYMEVVRCRDCKHFAEVRMADGTTSHRCSGVMAFVDNTPEDYCSWGRRDS